MQRNSTLYTIGFAALVCAVCSILVSSSAVGLRERQRRNQILERQRNVLAVSGLMEPGERLSRSEVEERFKNNIVAKIATLESGEYDDRVAPETFDQRRAAKDPATRRPAPENDAGIVRLPKHGLIYHVLKDGEVDTIVLPVEGRGLWSMMYGYLALDRDTTTVKGITFYEQAETPGLGGEIDNPRWKGLWPGRKVYNEKWEPQIEIVKGQAGPPDTDPHRVDGLSGATLTGRGVQNLLRFWLGDDGFGPYLNRFREERS